MSGGRCRGIKCWRFAKSSISDKSAERAWASQRAGVEIHEYVPTMMHAKIMIVDGVWSLVGSGNFDNRSLEFNDEIRIAVHDADLGRRLTMAFEADLRRSKHWSPADWWKRPWHWKARELFSGIFGEVF